MRFVQVIVFVLFMLRGVAMAGDAAQARSGSTPTPRAAATEQRKLDRGKAEVKRLQRDVEQQELDSQRASERLQQQDKTIVELQRQLQALQSSHAGGPR